MPLKLPSVYYESHAFTVSYDLDRSLGMAVWQGRLPSADLQEAFLICSYVVDKFNLSRWLADDRKMKGFTEEDKKWIAENVAPSMIAGPLRRMAILPSEDEEQVEAIEHLIQRAGDLGDFIIKSFFDEDEALQWLMREL
ncbi:hypothetical protein [Sabulibacter ruber]|uniref:hypothetical protein n=1 Tax=Sabulibacter ruber TaxID=2811901 RepID=UPI001A97CAB5|nr:hypothetical protein [Sabulibacter ruber]